MNTFQNYLIFIYSFLISFFLIFKYKQNNNIIIISQSPSKPDSSCKDKFILDFEFQNYEREIITESMKKYAEWELYQNEPYFINGIIRKFKPKNCLEIGVSKGGGSILILNAIKDYNDSRLVSLDLNTNLYNNKSLQTGCNVKQYFPELIKNNKWQLYTGKLPHIFLEKLNIKFDFLFLDTSHLVPGEILNIIEALPFLEENAIIILHDIMFHLPSHKYYNPKEVKYHPSMIYLMTSLSGNKIVMKDHKYGLENIGAIFLKSNQNQYYLNYFTLLLSPWEYMLSEAQIASIRIFIKKYYKEDIYLKLFNKAIFENKKYIKNFKVYNNKKSN